MKKRSGEAVEYFIPSLEMAESGFELFEHAVEAVAVLGKIFPPLAIALEAGVGAFEVLEDRHSKHMTRLDKAAQIFVVGCTASAGVLGALALGVTALSPVMPLALGIGAGVIGLGAVHRAYLQYKDPDYIALKQKRQQLKAEISDQLDKLDNPEVKAKLTHPNVSFNEKWALLKQHSENMGDKMASFESQINGYKKRKTEIRQLGVKGLFHGLLFSVALIGIFATLANPLALPITVSVLCTAFIVNKTGIMSKVQGLFTQIKESLMQKAGGEGAKGEAMEKQYGLSGADAKQVDAMSDHERAVYHRVQEGSHQDKLAVVIDYQKLNHVEKEVFHELVDSHQQHQILQHMKDERFDESSHKNKEDYQSVITNKCKAPSLKM